MWTFHQRWFILAAIAVTMATGDDDVTSASSVTEVATTEEPMTVLSVMITERQTSSIGLTWDAPKEGEVLSYRITGQKTDSEDTIFGPMLDPAENEYVMENLVANSHYNVCVVADLKDEDGDANLVDCRATTTIPLVRVDSVLALLATIGYIFLMVMIGVICWTCAKKKLRREMEEDEEEDEEEALPEKVQPVSFTPAYVSPPSESLQRSSIEDNPDIPYITPPADQLNKPSEFNAKV